MTGGYDVGVPVVVARTPSERESDMDKWFVIDYPPDDDDGVVIRGPFDHIETACVIRRHLESDGPDSPWNDGTRHNLRIETRAVDGDTPLSSVERTALEWIADLAERQDPNAPDAARYLTDLYSVLDAIAKEAREALR